MMPRALLLLALAAGALFGDELQVPDMRAFTARLLASYVFVGTGSGVVVSADGMVLTNHHVIDSVFDYSVRFASGIQRPAHLLGTDPVGDITLLLIDDGHDLPHADLAPADCLVVGSDVIAIGNPFGLGDLDDVPTLTQGVLGTSRIVRGDYTDAVQGDAPVNPGNSGGPLFDLHGRLLGINGQIRSMSGFRINSGIGLAIASTQLSAFLPLLRAADGGYVHHTCLPKAVELVADEDGVRVAHPGETELHVNDRLVRIAGRPAVSIATAIGLFSSLPYRPDATIPVTVQRAGELLELSIPAARQTIPGHPYHGLSIDETDGHVVIDGIDPLSPAMDAKLQVGDILLSANGRTLAHKIDWLKATVKLEIGDRLDLVVQGKDGTERMLSLRLRRQ